jgi:hypothetical protein
MTANLGGFSIQTRVCPIGSGAAWTLERHRHFVHRALCKTLRKSAAPGRDDGARSLMQPCRRAAPFLRWSGPTGPVACRSGGQPRPKQMSPSVDGAAGSLLRGDRRTAGRRHRASRRSRSEYGVAIIEMAGTSPPVEPWTVSDRIGSQQTVNYCNIAISGS